VKDTLSPLEQWQNGNQALTVVIARPAIPSQLLMFVLNRLCRTNIFRPYISLTFLFLPDLLSRGFQMGHHDALVRCLGVHGLRMLALNAF